MTNNTLNGALEALGELMAENLETKNVQANASDGLTTLANRILDIEPSISGLELDTNVTCSCSESEVIVGSSVVFTAKLTASYDDTSIVDVDLSGVLTGATVDFYSGNTLLGTGVTDINGIATFTHVFNDTGAFNIHSVFSGTENFDECVSSSINVNVNYILSISSDKSILSYNDGDIANITCNVSDLDGSVSGETVYYQILHDDTVLDSGSDVTDNNGDISIEYVSSGIGDVSITFSLYNLLQEPSVIEDYRFYDASSNSNLSEYTAGSGVTITYDSANEAYLLTKTTNRGYSPIQIGTFSLPNTASISVDFKFTGSNNQQFKFGLFNGDSGIGMNIVKTDVDSLYIPQILAKTTGGSNITGQTNLNLTSNTWYTLKCTYTDSNFLFVLKQGNTVLATNTYSQSTLASTGNDLFFILGYHDSTRVNVKNITVDKCSLLQKTFVVEDCFEVDSLTSDNGKFSLTGSANITYSANGLSMVGSNNATSLYRYNGTIPSNYIVEVDVVSFTIGAYDFGSEIIASHSAISNSRTQTRFGTFPNDYGSSGFTYTDVSIINTPYHLKIVVENGTATFYVDDVQVHQRSAGSTDFGLKSYNNRGVLIKNLKIKAL